MEQASGLRLKKTQQRDSQLLSIASSMNILGPLPAGLTGLQANSHLEIIISFWSKKFQYYDDLF